MSEFAVGIAIGATVGAAASSTIKHVEGMGKAVQGLGRRLEKVGEVRELEEAFAQTGDAARAARERVEALGDALGESDAPAEEMGAALADAREEGSSPLARGTRSRC